MPVRPLNDPINRSKPASTAARRSGSESKYVDKLVEDHGVGTARRFHMTFRLIDDVLSAGNPSFSDHVQQMYPQSLSLNCTNVSDTEVNFLGMSIKWMGHLSIDVFDKRSEFPFNVIRYPNMDSNIPTSLPYGSFTGGLYRLYRICNDSKVFLSRAIEFAVLLLRQGCTKSRLIALFQRFLKRCLFFRYRVHLNTLRRDFKLGLRDAFL